MSRKQSSSGAEKRRPEKSRGTVLFAANSSWNLVNFRAPIIRGLQARGWRIVAAVPLDEATPALRQMGVEVKPIVVDAKGLSPLKDLALVARYRNLISEIAPQAFLGFTPKPNIYGSLAAARCGVPVINTVTGLGTGFLSGRALQGLVSLLYRLSLSRSARVFFHNQDDLEMFVDKRLVGRSQAAVVGGSGIDLDHFAPVPRRRGGKLPVFLFIGRFLRDKGVHEFIESVALVKRETEAKFRMAGTIEEHPKAANRRIVESAAANGDIEILGTTSDIRAFIADADCVVLPSYREGLPRVLLEASAMAIPVIATDVPGCRHAVDHGVTGLLCEARSATALAAAMLRFAAMPDEQRLAMGLKGRAKVQREYSEERVIAAYVDALESLRL